MGADPPRTRRDILAAAEELIREEGFGAATTRAIAARAGCAEGSIYRHFPDKHALIIEIVRSRFPEFMDLVAALPDRAGQRTLGQNLEELAAAALPFYRGILPLVVGTMADHRLLMNQRRAFQETGGGPMRLFRAASAYLGRERELGRLSPGVSPDHVARLLLGACFTQAFLEQVMGKVAALGADRDFARKTVTALLEGARSVAEAPAHSGNENPVR
ncbi:MAG TPA: TetR/AcrR family transcriptional regulator [Acidimicrobiales bacterium]|nr:TetR/AcrR family transcriptional regulator [Acidimicrobiales bacterium]